MSRKAAAIALGFSAVALAGPALAGTPYEMKLTCPVGGETFTHTGTGSYSTYGSRPDGKPYGSWMFPIPIPVCLDNGLVMFREFEEAEVESLTALVLSEEYRALLSETSYYRAQWLSDRLDKGTAAPPWLLMRAGWQVDHDPERKERYQREFAERAGSSPVVPDDFETLVLRYRVANAWRELGDFRRASTALDSIPTQVLDVEIPDREDTEYETVQEAENRRYLLDLLGPMRAVIEAGNTHSEPLSLIPEDIAIYRCAEMPDEAQEPEDPFCSADERAGEVAEARERRRQRKAERESD